MIFGLSEDVFVRVLKYMVGCKFVNSFIFLCKWSSLVFGWMVKFMLVYFGLFIVFNRMVFVVIVFFMVVLVIGILFVLMEYFFIRVFFIWNDRLWFDES